MANGFDVTLYRLEPGPPPFHNARGRGLDARGGAHSTRGTKVGKAHRKSGKLDGLRLISG